jgi:hypothetical protein
MLRSTWKIIQSDPQIKWLLFAGLMIQVLTSITAIGVSSADQHFQIVEFSMHQLGKPSGASYVWEFDHFVRPTLQVYLFSAYHMACNGIGITDPYQQLTILPYCAYYLGSLCSLYLTCLPFTSLPSNPERSCSAYCC